MTEKFVPIELSIRAVLQLAVAELPHPLRVQLANLLADTNNEQTVELPKDFDIPWIVPVAMLEECFPFIRISNDDLQEFNPPYHVNILSRCHLASGNVPNWPSCRYNPAFMHYTLFEDEGMLWTVVALIYWGHVVAREMT